MMGATQNSHSCPRAHPPANTATPVERAGFAPIAIGLALTLIHLISIPVTNTSVNPARSIGPALFAGTDAIAQLWLFILAPVLGALAAGFSYAFLFEEGPAAPLEEATAG